MGEHVAQLLPFESTIHPPQYGRSQYERQYDLASLAYQSMHVCFFLNKDYPAKL